MEYFAEIKPTCPFFKEWYKYYNNKEELRLLVNEFCREHNIESNLFIANPVCFAIIPTINDMTKFKSYFKKYPMKKDNRVWEFKRSAPICKAFYQMLENKDYHFMFSPSIETSIPIDYTLLTLEKFNKLLIKYTLPVGYEDPEFSENLKEYFIPITGSEYYKYFEDYKKLKDL